MSTGFVHHEIYLWHESGNHAGTLPHGNPVQPGEHAEHQETKRRIRNLLEVSGLLNQLTKVEARHATEKDLLRVHTPEHIQNMMEISAGEGAITGDHSYCGHGSYEIATLSAGGVIAAVDAVMSGDIQNVYALVRPPGHHAEANFSKGFCIFGNAAIAGKYALDAHNLDRVAFVDWDVHHGNGTQSAFWSDRRGLTISIHQDQCFPPDSGYVTENGEGDGEGFNINIPLPAGAGVPAYEAAFDRIVVPALQIYKPQLIIVLSGLDAGAMDPLARMQMTSAGYRSLTRKIMNVADQVCNGRIVMCHEGGYHAPSVPFYALAIVEQLSGIKTEVEDPLLDFFNSQGGQVYLPHHDAAIREAEALVSKLKEQI
ncbi:MAG: class II histone deacetylase [Gammaproteobacteria bacterium]|nr:MAG: class II histone deacetylase [Gammaproteobacteria bacterium]